MQIKCEFKFDSFFGTPQLSIELDTVELYRGSVESVLSFDVDQIEEGEHQFKITHFGKTKHDQNKDHDKHIRLVNLTIDEVNLDQLEHSKLTHQGRFYPNYHPDFVHDNAIAGNVLPEFIQPNHYFGHNGTWILDFKYPVLLWVIKEQNPSGICLEDTIFTSKQETIDDIKDFFGLDD